MAFTESWFGAEIRHDSAMRIHALALLLLVACSGAKTTGPTGPSNATVDQPQLVRTSPKNGDLNVAADIGIEIEFDRDVKVSGEWLVLQCDSGSASNEFLGITGGPRTFRIPPIGLPPGEVCFVNLIASGIKSATEVTPAGDMSFGFLVKGNAPAAAADTLVADRRRGFQSEDGALLLNDTRGDFPAGVVAFGGGDISESAEDIPADQFVEFGEDGLIGVSASGQVVLLPPTLATEDIHFSYIIANYAGQSTADVTAQIIESPLVKRDDGYVAIGGQTLTIAAPAGVLANDELGIPAATLVNFGAGDLGTDALQYDAGETATITAGVIQQNADGGFVVTPTLGFRGTIRWVYVLENSAGLFGGEVVVTVLGPPIANNDTYTDLVVNTPVAVGASGPTGPRVALTGSVLDNDTAGSGPSALAVTPFTTTTGLGGTVEMAANGTFIYTPGLNFAATDTFSYSVTDGYLTASATVSLTFNSNRVLYVRAAAAPGGNGRPSAPFTTVAAAQLTAPADPLVLVLMDAGNQSEDVTLAANQQLLGRGAAVTITAGASSRTVLAASSPSNISSLVVNSGTRVSGISVVQPNASAIVTIALGTTTTDLQFNTLACGSCPKVIDMLAASAAGTIRVARITATTTLVAVDLGTFTGSFTLRRSDADITNNANRSQIDGPGGIAGQGSALSVEGLDSTTSADPVISYARTEGSGDIELSGNTLVSPAHEVLVNASGTAVVHVIGFTGDPAGPTDSKLPLELFLAGRSGAGATATVLIADTATVQP